MGAYDNPFYGIKICGLDGKGGLANEFKTMISLWVYSLIGKLRNRYEVENELYDELKAGELKS